MDDKFFAQFQTINEKVIETSNAVVKAALLINGGAAVAVLSFVAAVSGKNGLSMSLVVGVSDALMLFAWGAITAIGALALSYLTNASLLSVINAMVIGRHEIAWRRVKLALHTSAVVAVFGSVALFGLGASGVKDAIAYGIEAQNSEHNVGTAETR